MRLENLCHIDDLLHWTAEREAIRLRRAAGAPPPWTDDPIMRAWRFCNIRRSDDRVTRWISYNWRDPHADDPDVWFAMAVARLVNWPDTMAALGYPVPWDPERFVAVIASRPAGQAFGPAYNIGNGGQRLPKAEHLASNVLGPLWARRKSLRARADETVHTYYGRLRAMKGFASFMAGQVIADVKYLMPLRSARDFATFAVPGPAASVA